MLLGGVVNTPPLKVWIILPGTTCSHRFLQCWTDSLAQLWTIQRYHIRVTIGCTEGDSATYGILKGHCPFVPELYDVAVIIESTVTFTADNLVNLIEGTRIHPVVAAYYAMPDEIYVCSQNSFGTYAKLAEIEAYAANPVHRYISVSHTGVGCMAARKTVIDVMIPATKAGTWDLSNACIEANISVVIDSMTRIGHEVTKIV
jgi:hypothetical protein